MKAAIALLVVLVLAAASGLRVEADDHTYIRNGSSRSIRATTSYIGGYGDSKFENRLITTGTSDPDEYTDFPGKVHIELWVDGSNAHNNVEIHPDNSIVGYDNIDGTGVDIFEAAYGTVFQKGSGVLITIFP